MTQTTEVPMDVWGGWRFHTQESMVEALDAYARFQGQPMITKVDPAGENGEWWNHPDGCQCLPCRQCRDQERAMKANHAIDRAMARLRHLHLLSHRLLDAYYRGGTCNEHDGWCKALQRAQLPYHPQTKREREILESVFDGLLKAATDALFVAHNVRPQRH